MFFLILFFSVFICFAEEIFESNALGMKLREIDAPSGSGTGWVLRVRQRDGVETVRLFSDGALYSEKTIVREGGRETETKFENELRETVVRENGLVISEESENTDGSIGKTIYAYSGSRLDSSEYSVDGETVYIERYMYTDEGRLLDFCREYSADGSRLSNAFVFNEGLISAYWMHSEEIKNYIRFTGRNIEKNEIFGEGAAEQLREYEQLPDGGSRETITDIETGKIAELLYDSEKQLVNKKLYDEESRLVEESMYNYRNGYLSSVKVRSGLLLEHYIWDRDSEGEAEQERFYRNGVLVQQTEYESEDEYVQTLFRGGRAVLRLKYQNGERVLTEQLQE